VAQRLRPYFRGGTYAISHGFIRGDRVSGAVVFACARERARRSTVAWKSTHDDVHRDSRSVRDHAWRADHACSTDNKACRSNDDACGSDDTWRADHSAWTRQHAHDHGCAIGEDARQSAQDDEHRDDNDGVGDRGDRRHDHGFDHDALEPDRTKNQLETAARVAARSDAAERDDAEYRVERI
jgi:hypothetical protein